jgi:hypothetical protein
MRAEEAAVPVSQYSVMLSSIASRESASSSSPSWSVQA